MSFSVYLYDEHNCKRWRNIPVAESTASWATEADFLGYLVMMSPHGFLDEHFKRTGSVSLKLGGTLYTYTKNEGDVITEQKYLELSKQAEITAQNTYNTLISRHSSHTR